MNPVLVTASIFSTDKFILSQAEDSFHDSFTSIAGWHSFTAEPASVEWIGENLRRSLASARYVRLPPEQWDQALYDENRKRAEEVKDELLRRIASQFRYRSRGSVMAQALMVHAHWQKSSPGGLSIIAMNHKRGGYEALANDPKHADKVLDLSIDSSDHEIGAAVRRMLAVSTISGKRMPRNV